MQLWGYEPLAILYLYSHKNPTKSLKLYSKVYVPELLQHMEKSAADVLKGSKIVSYDSLEEA